MSREDKALLTLKSIKEFSLNELSPLGLSSEFLANWLDEAGIESSECERIIYIGGLYQSAPLVDEFVEAVREARRVEDVREAMSSIEGNELSRRFARIVGKVVRIVSSLVDAGCLGIEEPYSGILLHELGLIESFRERALRTHRLLEEFGIKEIITLDPHSYYAFKKLYPYIVDGWRVSVKHYMELKLDEEVEGRGGGRKVVVHDSCILSRRFKSFERPRELAVKAGYKLLEIRESRELSTCCGGVLKLTASKLSEKASSLRVSELISSGADLAVTLCPLCLTNLSAGGMEVVDLIELI